MTSGIPHTVEEIAMLKIFNMAGSNVRSIPLLDFVKAKAQQVSSFLSTKNESIQLLCLARSKVSPRGISITCGDGH